MPEKLTPFVPEEHFTTVRSQRILLADALESGHAGYIADALGIIARARGISALAGETGLTRNGLYKALSKEGDPRLSTVLAVMKALGVSLTLDGKTPAKPAPKAAKVRKSVKRLVRKAA